MLSRQNLRLSAERYLSGVLIYSLAMVLYTQHSYYKGLLRADTLSVLKILYVSYVIGGLPYLVFSDKTDKHKPQELLKAFRELRKAFKSFSVAFLPGRKLKRFILDIAYKRVLLFTVVKVFYVPLMLNFFFANFASVKSHIVRWQTTGFRFDFVRDYLFLFAVIFTLDTLVFCFGYLVELKPLKNMVKSVEPTLLGWVVALASYPPFNSVTGQYLNWYASDNFFFKNGVIDVLAKIAVVGLLGLYLWATFSLGAKASNLTNRGIVGRGAYRWIRHPAYTGKVLAWWVMALPKISIAMVLSLLGWSLVYYLRAITEERHLIKDEEYRKYVRKTKYRFIPGVI